MKFTKEEISLCRQIAEKHRKEIKKGNWILDEHSEVRLTDRIQGEILSVSDNDSTRFISQYNPNVTPLWTISDCLSWLNKTKDITLRICSHPYINQTTLEYDDSEDYGKTPLEACLKAVLAVIKAK